MKRLLKWLGWSFFSGCLLLVALNAWVILKTSNQLLENPDELEGAPVALVLGTSKSTTGGKENLYFKDRMKAAAELYHLGKVKHLLVSGDNRTKYYNEPRDMNRALTELGVPNSAITSDFAGLRTLDSVVRCKEIFDQDEIIIVTQRFHAHRALFIANHYGIKCQAYPADFESNTLPTMHIREFFARALAVADLFITGTKPRYLGEKENLPEL